MSDKKGLSDIVATVLIVLLALAAVAIVWGFLRPMFDTAAQETDLRSMCFSVDVQPTLCTYDSTTITARARNMAGEAKYVMAVLDNADGSTYISWRENAGELLSTIPFGNETTGLTSTSLRDFTVSGIVADDAGNEETCPGTTITCVWTGS